LQHETADLSFLGRNLTDTDVVFGEQPASWVNAGVSVQTIGTAIAAWRAWADVLD